MIRRLSRGLGPDRSGLEFKDMLEGMRKAGQGLAGRIIITILFGFLIFSFAIWGIGDMIRGVGRNTVAKVGSVEITPDAVRNAYQAELQRLSRQYRQTITPERARAMGLDAQVFGKLVTEAALDQKAHDLGLGISDKAVAETIAADPTFKGPNGQFDRQTFNGLLQANGLNEAAYVQDQKSGLVRQQIAEAVAGGVTAPLAIRETVYRFGAERRAISYFILPAKAVGEIAKPDDAALQTYFDARKSAYRAPEYRKLTLLTLTPEEITKPQDVTNAEAKARYEEIKTSRFGTPERRTIQQIAFKSAADAQAAADKIKAGSTFDDIAKEQGASEQDITLGTFARDGVFDPAVRDVAFGLSEGGVSAPLEGKFGPVLVRVTKIEPQSVKPYEAVATEVKQDIALDKARRAIGDLHDKIEDQRAAYKPLSEIAPGFGLKVTNVPAVNREGLDKNGAKVDLGADASAILTPAFASDIGADNEAVRLKSGGYIWFEVAGIEPAHDRPLAEVRDKVVADWTDDQIAQKLSDKARELVKAADGGADFTKVASDAGQSVAKAEGLARNTASAPLTADAVSQVFAVHVGKAGSAALDNGQQRVIFQVNAATVPPFITTTPEAIQLDQRVRNAVQDDLLTEYVAQVQKDLGVTVNQQALRTALGSGTGGEF
jgi:peptidyl-prolyl cis-trans isomerase D